MAAARVAYAASERAGLRRDGERQRRECKAGDAKQRMLYRISDARARRIRVIGDAGGADQTIGEA